MLIENYPMVERAITPDAPAEVLGAVACSAQLRPVRDALTERAKVWQTLRIWRQQKINEANARIEHRLVEGLGEKIASIDIEIYFQMMLLHGAECWSDRAFLDSFLAKNPGIRIRANLPARVRVDGFRDHNFRGGVEASTPITANQRGGMVASGEPGTASCVESSTCSAHETLRAGSLSVTL